jgi:hypothetical protein
MPVLFAIVSAPPDEIVRLAPVAIVIVLAFEAAVTIG